MARLAPIVLTALGYYGLSRLGLLLIADDVSIAAVWPASGFLLGVLAISPRNQWASLLGAAYVANLVANLHSGNPLDASLALGVANVCEALLAVVVYGRIAGATGRMRGLRDYLALLGGAAVAANALTALLGAITVVAFFGGGFGRAWVVWAVADGIGMAVVAPLVILMATEWRSGTVRRLLSWEAAGYLAVLAGLSWLIFFSDPSESRTVLDFPYPILPVLTLIAIRLRPAHTAMAGWIVAVIGASATVDGSGPFARSDLTQAQQILEFQGFVGVFIAVALFVAGLMQQLRSGTEALKEREIQARSVVEESDDAFISIDHLGTVTAWNHAAGRLLGWGAGEAIGRRLSELIIPPELRAAHEHGLRRYMETGEGRVIGKPLELDALDREGAVRPVELTISALPRPNGLTEFTAVLRDIEDRKAVELERQGQRELLERAVDAVYRMADDAGRGDVATLVCDVIRAAMGTDYTILIGSEGDSHRYRSASGMTVDPAETPREGAVLALESREPLFVQKIGSDSRVAGGPLARAGAASGVWQPLVRRGRVLGLLEVGWIDQQQPPEPHFLATLGLLGSAAASTLERAALMTELTERQETLETQQAELARSNKELEQFGSMVSHDLSTPLRTISGRMGMLKRRHGDELTEGAVEMIDAASKEVDRLGEMLASLMRYSKVGSELVNRREVDMTHIAAEAFSSLEPVAAEVGGTVEIGPLPVVEAEPSLVRELVQNLISNALKHGGQGVHVRVESEQTDAGVVYSVTDDGPGIPESEQDRMFKIFARGGEAAPGGHGVGLAICELVAKKHGGRLWVESPPEGGTAFRFTLAPGPSGRI